MCTLCNLLYMCVYTPACPSFPYIFCIECMVSICEYIQNVNDLGKNDYY